MLSGVLRSDRAVEVNIAIMRTFVRMREMFANHEDLARKVQKHDQKIASLYSHVQKLLTYVFSDPRCHLYYLHSFLNQEYISAKVFFRILSWLSTLAIPEKIIKKTNFSLI